MDHDPTAVAEMVSSCTSACCNAVRPERCAQSCLFGSRRRGEDLVPVRMRAATYKMPEADFERLMDIIKTDETQYVYELAFLLFVECGTEYTLQQVLESLKRHGCAF